MEDETEVEEFDELAVIDGHAALMRVISEELARWRSCTAERPSAEDVAWSMAPRVALMLGEDRGHILLTALCEGFAKDKLAAAAEE